MNRTTCYTFFCKQSSLKTNDFRTETKLKNKRNTQKFPYQILYLLSMVLVKKFPGHAILPTATGVNTRQHQVLK